MGRRFSRVASANWRAKVRTGSAVTADVAALMGDWSFSSQPQHRRLHAPSGLLLYARQYAQSYQEISPIAGFTPDSWCEGLFSPGIVQMDDIRGSLPVSAYSSGM